MQLVNEQNHIPFRLGRALNDALEALFKLAAIRRSGHQCAQIQCVNFAFFQRFRHIALNNALSQFLHQCSFSAQKKKKRKVKKLQKLQTEKKGKTRLRLPDTRLSKQNRIVF
jgi:hypothetical protein